MAERLGIYDTGTATVAAGATTVTLQAAGPIVNAVRPGDRFGSHVGDPIRITAVTATSLTLAYPWTGPAQTAAPYEIAFTPYDNGYRQALQELLDRYGGGPVAALAEVEGGLDRIPIFIGPDAMSTIDKAELVDGIRFDAQVNTLAGRDAYNAEAAGFTVLVSNVGDGRSAIYVRTGTSGWSAPSYITGPAITLDVTEVDEVPFGTPPDVTLTPRAGGYDVAFDLPRGMIIEPGTTTTLPPDQPAAVTFVPITGGFRLDIAIPRGPTGDIDGVTPFWVTRLGSDTDAAAARVGLGATSVGNAVFTAANAAFARDSIMASSGAVISKSFTSSGTWAPTNAAIIKAVKVRLVAAGGGAGGCGNGAAGGGGGAGGYSERTIIASDLTLAGVTVTVGAGGNGGSNAPGNGGNGGASSFGSYCSASGGTGGQSSAGTGGPYIGGIGSNGDINIRGGSGSNRSASEIQTTPPGGNSFFGIADAILISTGNYNASVLAPPPFGAGGLGPKSIPASGPYGGQAGGPGLVIVEEFY